MDNFFDEDENDFKPKKGLKISQSKTVAPNANKKKRSPSSSNVFSLGNF